MRTSIAVLGLSFSIAATGAATAQAAEPSGRAASLPAPASAPAAGAPSDVGDTLRALSRRHADLAGDVARSKGVLERIKGIVEGKSGALGRVEIAHRDEMGATYELVRLAYAIDGVSVAVPEPSAAASGTTAVWSGAISPGRHVIAVDAVYRGRGGPATYLGLYTFRVRSSHVLHVESAKLTRLTVVAHEREDWTLPMEERPTLRWDVEVR